jgi:hypothetical protein
LPAASLPLTVNTGQCRLSFGAVKDLILFCPKGGAEVNKAAVLSLLNIFGV